MPISDAVSKLRSGLSIGRAWLTQGLQGQRWDDDALEALESRLLTADAGIDATEWLIDQLKNLSAKEAELEPAKALEHLIAELLQPVEQPLELTAPTRPFVVLVVGVNGTGKTTSIGKLATRCRAAGLSVMLAAGDTYRAAAVEQLGVWAERIGCDIVKANMGEDPGAVAYNAAEAAIARGADILIVDTAGRLQTKKNLMAELEKIGRVLDTAGFGSSDFHIHGIASADSRVSDEKRVRQYAAEGVENPVMTDHHVHTDLVPTIDDLGFDGFFAQ